MDLFDHQKEILKNDPKKLGIFQSTGSGKTRTALYLAEGNTLVITTKTVRDEKTWEKEVDKIGQTKISSLCVISKEDFKKDNYSYYDTLIVDESHSTCGVTPFERYKNKVAIPKASQIFEKLLKYVQEKKPKRIYLLSATPIPQPMAVWGAAKILGKNWNFEEFRNIFYFRKIIRGRELWLLNKSESAKQRLGRIVQTLGVTGKLDDWFDVPKQTDVIINLPFLCEFTEKIVDLQLAFPDPVVLVGKMHQLEQEGDEKWKEIVKIASKHKKVVVFCKYTAQLDAGMAFFTRYFTPGEYLIQILDGRTKNRKNVLERANLASKSILLVQSQISEGYELPTFEAMVFASLSYSFVHYWQAKGRILRVNNLKQNWYYHLHTGEVDEAVYDCIMNKKDFSEKMYAEKRSKDHNKTTAMDQDESTDRTMGSEVN